MISFSPKKITRIITLKHSPVCPVKLKIHNLADQVLPRQTFFISMVNIGPHCLCGSVPLGLAHRCSLAGSIELGGAPCVDIINLKIKRAFQSERQTFI